MPILFQCDCGETLQADEALAGRMTRCPRCEAILRIPGPGADLEGHGGPIPSAPDHEPYGLEPPPRPDDPPADTPPQVPIQRPSPGMATSRPAPAPGSIREYAYLLLALALIPLAFSLLGKDESRETIVDRLRATLEKATPEQLQRAMPVLSREEKSLDDLLRVLPEGKLLDAHLPRDSGMHWIYAAVAAAGFLILTLGFFSVERANPLHLLGAGLFTGTVGIVFLMLVQLCSQIRFGRIHVRGWVALIMMILAFIGWSYRSALDPDSNFLLSAVGFTFGVGLCEELAKALPLFFYFQRDAARGWRGACLWGLASGVGFGVSEGIMYAGDHYNGVSGGEIYIVRFVSCVALHAMWAAAVGVAMARHIEDYEKASDQGEFAAFMLRMLAVPMLLHGLYDTLLKKDMNVYALVVAVVSFGWLAMQIESARAARPGPGGLGEPARRPAY
jgi:RsiW-degrading membrane proteinase PrsW (M82 family)